MKLKIKSQRFEIYKHTKINLCLFIIVCIFFIPFCYLPVKASGVSLDASLRLNNSIVSVGKNFTVTLMVNASTNADITAFDGSIIFDSSKISVIKKDNLPLITKPSAIPLLKGETLENKLQTSIYSNNEITFSFYDSTLQNPIKVRGNTELITFNFTVNSNAVIGAKAVFRISSLDVNVGYDSITPTITSTKTLTIGPKLETNAFLSSLSIEGAVLSPKFDKNVMNYKASVSKDVTSVKLTIVKESSKATVTVTGTSSLDYGDNTVSVTVTAQDTDVARRYKITVTRAFPETTPTEIVSSQDVSSETISIEPTITEIIATPTVEATPEPTPIPKTDERQLNFWKILTVVFAGLFLITLCILIWVAIDRNSMLDRDVKIRRL